jgi:hypothetical protein
MIINVFFIYIYFAYVYIYLIIYIYTCILFFTCTIYTSMFNYVYPHSGLLNPGSLARFKTELRQATSFGCPVTHVGIFLWGNVTAPLERIEDDRS